MKYKRKFSLLLGLFIFPLIYSIFFVANSPTHSFISVISSWLPFISMIVYLIWLGPFSVRGFDKELRVFLILFGVLSLITLIIYLLFGWLIYFVSDIVIKIFIVFSVFMILFLHIKIMKLLEKISPKKLEHYKRFIFQFDGNNFFRTSEYKRLSIIMWSLRVISFVVLSMVYITLFYFCLFTLVVLGCFLQFKIHRFFVEDKQIIRLTTIFTVCELLICIFVVLLTLYHLYPVSAVLILLSNFKIHFIREIIQSRAYNEVKLLLEED